MPSQYDNRDPKRTPRPFAQSEPIQRWTGSDSGSSGGGEIPPPAGPQNPATGTIDLTRVEAILSAILADALESTQRGIAYPVTMLIPDATPVPVVFDPPLFALSIINDGAGILQYRLPDKASGMWVDLRPTEVANFAFRKGVVASVAFRVLGVPATVRAIGSY